MDRRCDIGFADDASRSFAMKSEFVISMEKNYFYGPYSFIFNNAMKF